jgi:hypothetical protein
LNASCSSLKSIENPFGANRPVTASRSCQANGTGPPDTPAAVASRRTRMTSATAPPWHSTISSAVIAAYRRQSTHKTARHAIAGRRETARKHWASAPFGPRARDALQAGGRWFEPSTAHYKPGDAVRSHWLAGALELMLTDHQPDAPPVTVELQTGDQPIVIKARDGTSGASVVGARGGRRVGPRDVRSPDRFQPQPTCAATLEHASESALPRRRGVEYATVSAAEVWVAAAGAETHACPESPTQAKERRSTPPGSHDRARRLRCESR